MRVQCGAVVNFAPPIAIGFRRRCTLDAAEFIVQTGGPETGGFFPVGDNGCYFYRYRFSWK